MGLRLRLIIGLLGGLATLSAIVQPASAVVQTTGNVLLSPDSNVMNNPYTNVYADNPFTTTINEGVPTNGNRIDPFRGNTGAPLFQFVSNGQIEYEGRPVNNNSNVNFSVIVGRTSFGELIINQSQLRDMDLVIGDQAQVGTGSNIQRGSGVVRIEGFGSLYNNNPFIMPYVGIDPDTLTPDMISVIPRAATVGYDLLVGRYGNGVLQLALGGRAEIQDAVLIGNQSGSVGTLTIDGIDSFLQSGGFQVASNVPGVANYMVIGQLGSGTMTITNGGQSYNSGPRLSSGSQEQWAAVIGSNLAASSTTPPNPGGNGTVIVDGTSSKWTLAGNLQIGGFHSNRVSTGPFSPEDLEGELAEYGPSVGRGTLHISNGGLVSVVAPPTNVTSPISPDRLDLLVGRFGRVELDGGRIELLGLFDNSNPQNPTQQLTHGRLINDGVVLGDGSISVLQFRNRVIGEVRVGAGQSMVIAATGRYTLDNDNFPLPDDDEEYPLSNYGLIEVRGTPEVLAELEFQRNVVTIPTPQSQTRPFLNLPSPPAPNGRTGGEIVAQNSALRFDSNIINRHKVTFTGGTNLVTGNFVNAGSVVVGGIDTTVTFVDQFFNFGTLTLEPSVSLVTFIDDVDFDPDPVTLGLAEVGPRILNMSFGNHISSNEEILLGGTLNASLFTAPGFPGSVPLAGSQFEIISSATALTGDFDTVNLPDCINGICFFGFADDILDSYFIRSFDLNSPNVVGGDFDGSGLVDDLDFQIWRQNLGSTGAPGSLPGDANNDGIVDGDDFLVWLAQFGGPGMPGAGSGSFQGGPFAVPEPASVALAMAGGMLALAFARRREG